jgi:hypothetical protein
MEVNMKRISNLLLVLFSCLAFVLESQAGQEPKFTKFNVPHAGRGAGQGTIPVGIVHRGWIMGSYIDRKGISHGFLRAPDGTITEFDLPTGTILEVWGMNPELEIAGTYIDANNVLHGFLRTPHGKFITIDAPGAGTAAYQGTESESLNPAGVLQGDYADANGAYHGFIRAPDGTFTTFDIGGTGTSQGVYPAIFSGINPEGATVGEYVDINNVYHGYVRAPDGTITELDNPNAGTGTSQGTGISGINPAGEINGWYIDPNNVFHGFLRAPDGTMKEVDVPGAGTGIYQGTDAAEYMFAYGGINPAGTITGYYADANNVYHGYLRTRDGNFVTLDVLGAGTGNWQGTLPLNINPKGEIAGYYIDANDAYHGFLVTW